MADDPLSAALAKIREHRRVAVEEPGGADPNGPLLQGFALADLVVSDVPRLLAAVDATLRHHRPIPSVRYCETCAKPWPCPEVADILAALTGKAADHG